MAQRIVRRAPRIVPSNPALQSSELHEVAGQDPSSPQDQEGLAQIAFLVNGVSPTNSAVAQYIQQLNNQIYSQAMASALQNGALP